MSCLALFTHLQGHTKYFDNTTFCERKLLLHFEICGVFLSLSKFFMDVYTFIAHIQGCTKTFVNINFYKDKIILKKNYCVTHSPTELHSLYQEILIECNKITVYKSQLIEVSFSCAMRP